MAYWIKILKLLTLAKILVFLVAAGGMPLTMAQQGAPVRTLISLQQELSAFNRLPLFAQIAQIRENPAEPHLVMQLLDNLGDHCRNVGRLCDLVTDEIRDMDEEIKEPPLVEAELLIKNLARNIANLGEEDE